MGGDADCLSVLQIEGKAEPEKRTDSRGSRLSIIRRGGVKGKEGQGGGLRSEESCGPGEPLSPQHLLSVLSSPLPSRAPNHPSICKHHELPSDSCCSCPCFEETPLIRRFPAQTVPDRGEEQLPSRRQPDLTSRQALQWGPVRIWEWTRGESPAGWRVRLENPTILRKQYP